MDFSRLHMYTPPQCVPENTGYTYALSSSYSSDALDFEMEHKLNPVFDSPRMSRRHLRSVTTAYRTEGGPAGDAPSCVSSTVSLRDRVARTAKQHRSASKLTLRGSQAPREATAGQRPSVLDESLIREQTRVDHFWGLDDDGDLKGGSKAAMQHNGDTAAEEAAVNGYTCADCSMLSERKHTLTAYPSSRATASRACWSDSSQKRGVSLYLDRTVWLVTRTSSSVSSFLVQLFQVLLMKLNYESENYKLKSYESKDRGSENYKSESHESEAHYDHGGKMNVREFLGEDGHLRANGAALWKAASAVFWWLGSGWYQFVTLISWLNVFLLTRCLRNTCKFLMLLIPLSLLLGAGLSLWGHADLLSFLPVVNWTRVYRVQRADDTKDMLTPDASHLGPPLEGADEALRWHGTGDVHGLCQSHEEKLRGLTASLQKLQARVDQLDGPGVATVVRSLVVQQLEDTGAHRLLHAQAEYATSHQEQEVRISNLEDLLGKLTGKSEAIRKELEQTTLRTASSVEEAQRLLSVVNALELELGRLRAELPRGQCTESSCDQGGVPPVTAAEVDAQVRDTVRRLFSEDQEAGPLQRLLQKLASRFVSKDGLQVLLRDLELQILKNVTHHLAVTKQLLAPEAVASAMKEAGVSGITEAHARVLVNSALKLYSQDKTGMVDFALESGGGSILGTRCSETHETKTALISLFGVPLWYFSQSPRVVIQPDVYPGNCWAFKGSQGYLVVRLSMRIHPTSFTLEHIPKSLSPTGSITSAPKDFSVHGLENEYDEEGELLGQFTYDQEGESLQMFHVLKRPDSAFQIVELRILSNWGHPEYTCLYRFRVHGEPAQ